MSRSIPPLEKSDEPVVLDLGGALGGRFWIVTSDHPADDVDVYNAAVYARLTGSVEANYNEASVRGLKVEERIAGSS